MKRHLLGVGSHRCRGRRRRARIGLRHRPLPPRRPTDRPSRRPPSTTSSGARGHRGRRLPAASGEHRPQPGQPPRERVARDLLMAFTSAVLTVQVNDLLAEQYAATKGISSPPPTWPPPNPISSHTRRRDQPAGADGRVGGHRLLLPGGQRRRPSPAPSCSPDCPPMWPPPRFSNQAVDEKLLARGADLSNSAVANTTPRTSRSSPRPA